MRNSTTHILLAVFTFAAGEGIGAYWALDKNGYSGTFPEEGHLSNGTFKRIGGIMEDKRYEFKRSVVSEICHDWADHVIPFDSENLNEHSKEVSDCTVLFFESQNP